MKYLRHLDLLKCDNRLKLTRAFQFIRQADGLCFTWDCAHWICNVIRPYQVVAAKTYAGGNLIQPYGQAEK